MPKCYAMKLLHGASKPICSYVTVYEFDNSKERDGFVANSLNNALTCSPVIAEKVGKAMIKCNGSWICRNKLGRFVGLNGDFQTPKEAYEDIKNGSSKARKLAKEFPDMYDLDPVRI